MGDFNIDGFDDYMNHRLVNLLGDFELIINEPIHLDGGLLDHVYLSRTFIKENKPPHLFEIFISQIMMQLNFR